MILATHGKSVINSEHIKSVVGERGNGNQIVCTSYDDIALGVHASNLDFKIIIIITIISSNSENIFY